MEEKNNHGESMKNNHCVDGCENYSALSEEAVPYRDGKFSEKFKDEEEAVFSLYEQLFDTADTIDKDMIYDAMRYLLWKKEMHSQHQEIKKMDGSFLCVNHLQEIDEEVKGEILFLKTKLHSFIDEFM